MRHKFDFLKNDTLRNGFCSITKIVVLWEPHLLPDSAVELAVLVNGHFSVALHAHSPACREGLTCVHIAWHVSVGHGRRLNGFDAHQPLAPDKMGDEWGRARGWRAHRTHSLPWGDGEQRVLTPLRWV